MRETGKKLQLHLGLGFWMGFWIAGYRFKGFVVGFRVWVEG